MPNKSIKLFTLCFVQEGHHVLLGMKKRGFGEGKWNGFGGKVEQDETVTDAAVRELEEECGLLARSLERRAQFDFVSDADPAILRVSVFSVLEYSGEPSESEEMRPKWFSRHEVPYQEMWADDIHWLPKFLQGEWMRGTFRFDDLDNPNAKLLDYRIEIVE